MTLAWIKLMWRRWFTKPKKPMVNTVHIIKRFDNGNLLIDINYSSIRTVTQKQYEQILKHYGL